jgi:hypothetical protein
MVAREREWDLLGDFVTSGSRHATLAVVWGRRRIGKSFLVSSLAAESGGFYYEAARGSSAEALRELGVALAAHEGAPAPFAFGSWDEALAGLLGLGRSRPTLVVLDEFPYLLESTPGLDSLIARA